MTLYDAIDALVASYNREPVTAFGGAPKMTPPPPPAPPPNPPTFAQAVATPQRQSALGGVGSTIATGPQGLVDQQMPGRKALFGA